MKICTFKVKDEFRGEKYGELLLKQVLWYAQANEYDLTYITAFPKQDFLSTCLAFTASSKQRSFRMENSS